MPGGKGLISVSYQFSMEERAEKLGEWKLKSEIIVSPRFPLEKAAAAYQVADERWSGKMCIVME